VSSAIDTNVILNLAGGDSLSAEATAVLLERESRIGGLTISPVVYAECLAHPGWKQADLDALLRETKIGMDWDMTETVWTTAGLRFAKYAARRRRSPDGHPRRILADFLIGAHGLSVGALITYDRFFEKYYPELRIIDR
jgi:predicted nucleic acid-binding protein